LEYVKEGMAGAGVLFVGEGADDGAEEHGGSEAGDEEAADVALVEAVLAVEVVDVGALQPVPGCTKEPVPFEAGGQATGETIRTNHNGVRRSKLKKGRGGTGGVHIMRE
jgi:hypothetical protein